MTDYKLTTETYSTKSLQKGKILYETIEECVEHRRNKTQTNKRYGNFWQTHFTIGDVEQFIQNRNLSNMSFDIPKKNSSMWQKLSLDKDKYSDLISQDVFNTFSYIFHKFS